MTSRFFQSMSLSAPSGMSGLSAYAMIAANTYRTTATSGRAMISHMEGL
jgi:hypothetical protein